jgi:hypothetical protein
MFSIIPSSSSLGSIRAMRPATVHMQCRPTNSRATDDTEELSGRAAVFHALCESVGYSLLSGLSVASSCPHGPWTPEVLRFCGATSRQSCDGGRPTGSRT